MLKSLQIAQNDLRIFMTNRGNLIGVLLIPIVFTLVLGYATVVPDPVYNIVVIDDDSTPQSAQFISELEAMNTAFVLHTDQPLQEAREAVYEGSRAAAVVIPVGFADALENFHEIQVDYYTSAAPGSSDVVRQSLEALVNRWNGAVVAAQTGQQVAANLGIDVEAQAIYETANAILAQEPVVYDFSLTASGDRELQPGEGFGQSVPGMGAMFVIFTVMGGLAALLRERQNWTLQRLVVMPVNRSQIVAGKILTYFTLGMIQYGLLFMLGTALGQSFGSDVLALILVMAAYTLAITALTFAIATVIRTEGQASSLPTVVALGMASLGGAWWPLEVVPPFMKIIGHFSPVAWAMDAFHALTYYDGTLIDVLPSLGVLLGIALVFFVIGVRGFQYE